VCAERDKARTDRLTHTLQSRAKCNDTATGCERAVARATPHERLAVDVTTLDTVVPCERDGKCDTVPHEPTTTTTTTTTGGSAAAAGANTPPLPSSAPHADDQPPRCHIARPHRWCPRAGGVARRGSNHDAYGYSL